MPTTSTTRPASRQVVSAVGHLIWTTAVIVGAPIALSRFFGWPLPTALPDWREVASTPLQLIDPVVILNLFVCLAWICWATVVVYVVLDIADTARGVGRRMHRIGPFDMVARKLVGSVVLLISLAHPIHAFASPARPAPVAHLIQSPIPHGIVAIPAPPAVSPTSPAVSASAASPVYVVQRGDSLWAIAEAHLGSGFRWTEIHDLNHDLIADPDIICIGWQLTLPSDANLPAASPAPVEEAAPVTPSPLADPAPATSPPNDQTPPAQTPTVDGAPVASAPSDETVPAPPPLEQAPPASLDTRRSAEPAASHAAGPPGTTTITNAPMAAELGGTPAPVTPATKAGQSDPAGLAAGQQGDMLPPLAPIVPGITGATVLATSLLLLLRGVRGRHALSGGETPRRLPALERTVVAAGDVPLVRWAGQELAMLGEQLAGRRSDANPVAVEFAEETGLELLWDRPFPDAPAPWEAVPGGWAWRLLYDPDEPVPHPERSALIAGLVTFGQRDGRQLLLDLEALGSLSITGDQPAVDGFIRALLLELGAGDELADVYVAVEQGAVDLSSAEHLPRLEVVEAAEARHRLAAASASTAKALDKIGSPSTFAYRIYSTPVLPLEVVVTITKTEDVDDIAALIASSPPRRGVAAILLGSAQDAAAHLHIEADGSARLEPLGVTFVAAGITAKTETAVSELLADLPMPDVIDTGPAADPDAAGWAEPMASGAEVDQHPEDQGATAYGRICSAQGAVRDVDVIDLTDGAPDVTDLEVIDDESWQPPAPRLLVRVLGQPALVDGPAIGRRELIVVVCVACLRRPARHEDIQDAVWGGDAVESKTVWNVVARARTQLGQWEDEPVLNKADRPDNTLRLADDVWTDLQVLRELHDRASVVSSSEAMPLLRDALTLIEGPPFDADGYEWARVHQFTLEAERLIERAALTLVDLALEAGDVDLARFAVLQGLRGLPGNEVLYRARMRIEDTAGNATAVRSAYHELVNYLDDLEAAPSADTSSLFRQLSGTEPKVTLGGQQNRPGRGQQPTGIR